VSFSEHMAAKWRTELDELEKRAEYWETGKLRAYENGVEVTDEQAPMLRRHAEALREAIAMIDTN
jgi:hypothetical protein